MVAAAAGAYALTPRRATSLMEASDSLSAMVPESFGGWTMIPNAGGVVVSNPAVQQLLDQLYADILSRVYVDNRGERVMVSLAYGRNQNRNLQVHKPEVCYVAQGFSLNAMRKVNLSTPLGMVPAMQLEAKLGQRHEPVTYWVRTGDAIIRGWAEQNLGRIRAGLQGYVPDGLLVRVSTIDPDAGHGFTVQNEFLADLLSALEPRHRRMFIGDLADRL